MSLFVDVKYANMLRPYLALYSPKSGYIWNFRCPVCGDSKKNLTKKRGFIYRPANKNYLSYKCHNCDFKSSFGEFLQRVSEHLYAEYIMEAYKEKTESKPTRIVEKMPDMFQEMEISDAILDSLQRLDKMSINHPAVKYLLNRKIPSDLHHLFYFTTKFKRYVNNIMPGKFSNLDNDHPRLVIPYFNKHGKCFAFQGRAFGKEEPKYYTIKIDERQDRIFGLERVDFSKLVYITEGPIDSLFLPNALAVSGSSYECPTIDAIKTNCVIVPDNEPRNKDVCKIINKTINSGYRICLWPETFEFKDINDGIKDGNLTKSDILSIINANIYQGASAKLRFVGWRKC